MTAKYGDSVVPLILTRDITDCSRCGTDHHEIMIAPINKAIQREHIIYTHSAICPNTGKIILVGFTDES